MLVLANQITARRFLSGHKSVHKLSRQFIVNKMADDLELIAFAREIILESFQIDLQREALEMVVGGRDVFVIQPKLSGMSLLFQSAPIFIDIVRLKCAKSIILVISPLVSFVLDQVRFLKSLGKSAEIIGGEQNCEQPKTIDLSTRLWEITTEFEGLFSRASCRGLLFKAEF